MKINFFLFFLFFFIFLNAQIDLKRALNQYNLSESELSFYEIGVLSANSHILFNDFTKAMNILNSLISEYPNIDYAYVERAKLKLTLNQEKYALLDLNKAKQLNSLNSEIYELYGNIYANLSEFEKAEKEYKNCLKLNKNNENCMGYLSSVLIELTKYNEAFNNSQLLFSKFPETNNLWFLSDFAYLLLLNKQYDRSIFYHTKILLLEPQNFLALVNRGISYININDIKKGCIDFNNAKKINMNKDLISLLNKYCN